MPKIIRVEKLNAECFRCEKISSKSLPIWKLENQARGFCEPCIFDLLKLVMAVEVLEVNQSVDTAGTVN